LAKLKAVGVQKIARQLAWPDVRSAGCFKAKLKEANVAAVPVHWTFGGTNGTIILRLINQQGIEVDF